MEEENKVGTEVTTEQTKVETTTKKTLDELLASDKDYQSEYDKKVTQAMKTRLDNERKKWEEEQKSKLAEAERLAKMDEEQKKSYELQQITDRATKAELALNAYKLKDETIRQASEKGIPIELIQTLDFEKETAESITSKLDIFEKTYKSEREKAIQEYSKEPAPQTGDRVDNTNLSGYEKFIKNMK